MSDIRMNEQQRAAITHVEGPALVLAGPGCGKTFVITHRVSYLIREMRIMPWQIAVFTFTKAAALQMKDRCAKICSESSQVIFGTFHSIFFSILLSDSRYAQFTILTEAEKKQILTQILYTYESDPTEVEQMLSQIVPALSYYLNTQTIPDLDMDASDFLRLAADYRHACLMQKKMDFDQILSVCADALATNASLRKKWQSCFRYLLVDEFQDTNETQMQVLSILSENTRNLFVVGDDDQSIYHFRGADPAMMLRFTQIYPEAAMLPLFENFRCSKRVLETAQASICNNKSRFEKELTAHKDEEGSVTFLIAKDRDEELAILAEKICALSREMPKEETIAVLCRQTSQLVQIRSQLKACGMPAEPQTQRGQWVMHADALEDIRSYLRFVFVKGDRDALLRVLNRPQRMLSLRFFEEPKVDLGKIAERYQKAWKKCDSQNEDHEVIRQLVRLERDLARLKMLDSYGCICYILGAMGYERWYLSRKEESERETAMELFARLKTLAKKYPNVPEYLERLRQTDACKGRDPGMEERNGQVCNLRLMTYHGAKGLEFDHVFLPFVNEHIVPHRKAKTNTETEEERRMFYVALTRARKTVTVSCVANSRERPSRFFDEINLQKRKRVFTPLPHQ